MLGGILLVTFCISVAQCAIVKRNQYANVPQSAVLEHRKSQQDPYRGGYAVPDDNFVAIYPPRKHNPVTEERNPHPNVPLSAVLEHRKSQQDPYRGGYAVPDDNFVAIYPPRKQNPVTEERNPHPNVPLSAVLEHMKSTGNSKQEPYRGGYAVPDDNFVAIYPPRKQNGVRAERNPHPNVPLSAVLEHMKSTGNSNQEPYRGGYAVPDDNFVAIYPPRKQNPVTEERNPHPNVPLSAVLEHMKSTGNSKQEPYRGGYAVPDDNFVAIYPPRKQNREATEQRDLGPNADFPFIDFSKIFENINMPVGSLQGGNPYDLSKMMENIKMASSSDTSENPFDFSKMTKPMDHTPDKNPFENPLDFSKMMKNINLPTGMVSSMDLSGLNESMSNLSKTMEMINGIYGDMNTTNLEYPDDKGAYKGPFDFSKIFENMNETTDNNPSGNPYDFLKMMNKMNMTAGFDPLTDLSGLDEMMANFSETMDKLNGLFGEVNSTSIDFFDKSDTFPQAFEDKLENMDRRLDDLEADVAHLKTFQTQVSGEGCPTNFVKNPETGSCYFLSKDRKSWNDALITCVKEHGAYLTNIETPEENMFLKRIMSEKNAKDDFYIGGRLRGKTFRWSHTSHKVRYFDWGPGEPNTDFETKERCMEIGFFNDFIGHYWKDTPCFFKKRYICEQDM